MKHVLLTLCGTSPAVVTETVYSLCINSSPPDEVIAITTTVGRHHLIDELFCSGVWRRLIRSLPGAPNIRFEDNSHHIRLLPAHRGVAEDVDSDQTNLLMADYILGTLRQFTENPDVKVTFSIAGGRKTMSAVSALAMSLLGRNEDELCHVLVNPPFDSPELKPRFYFPESGVVHSLPDGSFHPSSAAAIALCRIPFVRQRYLFADQLNRLPGDYLDMVMLANARITQTAEPAPLELLPETCCCRIGERIIELSCFEFTLLWLLARHKRHGKLPSVFHDYSSMHRAFVVFVQTIPTTLLPALSAERNKLLNKSAEQMRKPLSSLKIKLTKTLGKAGASHYLPVDEKRRYGLRLPAQKIVCPEF